MKEETARSIVKELFIDENFKDFVIKWKDGDLDPYDVRTWGIRKWGAFDYYNWTMDKNGARHANKMKTWGGIVLNITDKTDKKFKFIYINKHESEILKGMLGNQPKYRRCKL